MELWCKIRPGCIELLEYLRENFEVFVYTQGKQTYAEIILKYLDPDNLIFKNRLIARPDFDIKGNGAKHDTETIPKTFGALHELMRLHKMSTSTGSTSTNLHTIEELMQTTIVLDDRVDVWCSKEINASIDNEGMMLLPCHENSNIINFSPLVLVICRI